MICLHSFLKKEVHYWPQAEIQRTNSAVLLDCHCSERFWLAYKYVTRTQCLRFVIYEDGSWISESVQDILVLSLQLFDKNMDGTLHVYIFHHWGDTTADGLLLLAQSVLRCWHDISLYWWCSDTFPKFAVINCWKNVIELTKFVGFLIWIWHFCFGYFGIILLSIFVDFFTWTSKHLAVTSTETLNTGTAVCWTK